eukprot:3325596-Pyramimonas_sp.AAC.2
MCPNVSGAGPARHGLGLPQRGGPAGGNAKRPLPRIRRSEPQQHGERCICYSTNIVITARGPSGVLSAPLSLSAQEDP